MKAKQMEGQWVAEMTKRRELHNQLQDMVGSLRVACRVRPIKGDDTAITIKESTSGGDPQVVINYMGPGDKPAEKQFDFTHVYGPKSTQEQVFKDSAELMTSVLDGYNVCIFAYALGRVSDVAPAQTRAQPHTALTPLLLPLQVRPVGLREDAHDGRLEGDARVGAARDGAPLRGDQGARLGVEGAAAAAAPPALPSAPASRLPSPASHRPIHPPPRALPARSTRSSSRCSRSTTSGSATSSATARSKKR